MADFEHVTPRPAATVMVVRSQEDGFEVFMVRRHQASSFAADAFVFPGGTIRADDRLDNSEAREVGLEPAALRSILAAHDDPFAEQADGGLSLWVAALRELFEEAGLLLAEEQDGRLLDLSAAERAEYYRDLRQQVQQEQLSLAALARAERLRLAADRLAYFSRWITPPISPRRYDARFFVAELPAGQTAGHCQIETTDGLWISPRKALQHDERGGFPLMFVTLEHLRRLADFKTTAELFGSLRGRRSRAILAAVDDGSMPYLTAEQRRWWHGQV
jgi:8-oxo-dGTP pyrophosphatase MutT (NUDIX family)